LTCPSAETASIKATATVGANAPLTSGKETGIINVPWNVCEMEKAAVFQMMPEVD